MERLLFDSPSSAALLFGPQNLHLTILSKLSGAHIFNRGNTLCIDTNDTTIEQALLQIFCTLYDQIQKGKGIESEALPTLYRFFLAEKAEKQEGPNKTTTEEKTDTPGAIQTKEEPPPNASHRAPLPELSSINLPKKQVMARNPAQMRYMALLRQHDIVFALGAAGTGKTYIAVAHAVHLLLQHRVKKIILTRPAVEAGEKLGFLPGDLLEKINPYLRPLYDALYDMLSKPRVTALIELGSIEIAPLAFMRGRTLHEACIILDEAQNTTKEQMKMFLTRMGFGSKMIITGDCSQIDLPQESGGSPRQSGLIHAQRILASIPAIAFHTFTKEDVVRHQLVGEIVNAYDIDENRSTQV